MIDNIKFLSDDKPNDEDRQIEIKPSAINNICSILSLIKSSILSDRHFSDITLIVEVTEIKSYNAMSFIKLKDSTGIISGIIYKSVYKGNIEVGHKIKIKCRTELYNNTIQLNIKKYTDIGQGDETTKLAAIRTRLQKLGYFDNKPILQTDYDKIGIISSINAAGLKDFIHTLNNRSVNKKLYLYPATVQGLNAPSEIIKAINLANFHAQAQIIVLIRGGGSKEDLNCFNDETLAKKIHQSTIPIVTGIGHQIDVSIADEVCSKSFITPTAVAQNITRENINLDLNLIKTFEFLRVKIFDLFERQYIYLEEKQKKLVRYPFKINAIYQSTLSNSTTYQLNLQQKLTYLFDNKFSYINRSETTVNSIIDLCQNTIDNHLNLKLINIENLIESKIKLFEDNLMDLSRPYITDEANNEIRKKADLQKGSIYKIHFIDGVYNLNI